MKNGNRKGKKGELEVARLCRKEGYADPTPGNALKKICKEEVDKQNAADAARMEKALKRAKCILGDAGFDVIERIVLKNKRTGKIYR